jgi:hypothetical protein
MARSLSSLSSIVTRRLTLVAADNTREFARVLPLSSYTVMLRVGFNRHIH